MTDLETLFPYRPKRKAPRIRLVCFPFAGGAAATYKTWGAAFPDYVDVCPVELPGRGTRFGEELISTPSGIAEELAPLEGLSDLPIVYFGHSMGGRLAFMLARKGLRVDAMVLSGSRAAHVPATPRSKMSRPDLVDHLTRLGGTPREVLQDAEMLDLMLPIVRADLGVLESLKFELSEKVACPVTALAGTSDREATPADVEKWRMHADGDFRYIEIDAGHFFVQTHAEKVIAETRKVVEETLGRHADA